MFCFHESLLTLLLVVVEVVVGWCGHVVVEAALVSGESVDLRCEHGDLVMVGGNRPGATHLGLVIARSSRCLVLIIKAIKGKSIIYLSSESLTC